MELLQLMVGYAQNFTALWLFSCIELTTWQNVQMFEIRSYFNWCNFILGSKKTLNIESIVEKQMTCEVLLKTNLGMKMEKKN